MTQEARPAHLVHPRHVVAVTGVVTDTASRVLLVKGDERGWEPPGGRVELGEDLVTALRREVREESGCEVEMGRLACVHSNLGRPERGVPEQVVLTFSCRWTGGGPRAGEECSDAALFPADEALRLVEAPQQREKLRDALAAAGMPSREPRGYVTGRTGPRPTRRCSRLRGSRSYYSLVG